MPGNLLFKSSNKGTIKHASPFPFFTFYNLKAFLECRTAINSKAFQYICVVYISVTKYQPHAEQ